MLLLFLHALFTRPELFYGQWKCKKTQKPRVRKVKENKVTASEKHHNFIMIMFGGNKDDYL